jgi:CheY-like chemotaxis protein
MKTIEILLVEDNPGDIMLLSEALERSGLDHRLSLAPDGAAALDHLFRRGARAQAPRPDLILMDLNLPILNGREVLAELRLDPELDRLPLIIFSGSEWEKRVLGELGIPEANYFVKPMSFQGYLEAADRIRAYCAQLGASVQKPGPTG